MPTPILSEHYKTREPSSIRLSQIEFLKRKDKVEALNTAIGNVSLPMHPAMIKRLNSICSNESPFKNGVVAYTSTAGTEEANKAVKNIIASSGFKTDKLYSIITDGGSQSMELVIIGVCGKAGTGESPLLLIDPAYTNYVSFAERCGRKTVSVSRVLREDGTFSLPNFNEIEETIKKYKPGALVVIPYDNPTGQFYDKESMIKLSEICVKYNMWIISDEAYRELYYTEENVSSVWGIDDSVVPGIEGRRISIETASKVWNACGIRIGALVSDNAEFIQKAQAEYTANLCANALGQYIFGALACESHEELQKWYDKQRNYYRSMMTDVRNALLQKFPGIIVSSPEAALYSVVDVRNIANPGFNINDFVLFCARSGKVDIEGKSYTLLVAPMTGFYSHVKGEKNSAITQMRIAYVLPPEKMMLVPYLFEKLFHEFEGKNSF